MQIDTLTRLILVFCFMSGFCWEASADVNRVTVHIECGHWSIVNNAKSDKPKQYGSGAIISDGEDNYFILTALHVVSLKQEPEHIPYCEAYPNGPNTSWRLTLGEPVFDPLSENDYSKDKLKPIIPRGKHDVQMLKVYDESLNRYLTVCDVNNSIGPTTTIWQNGYRSYKNSSSSKVHFTPQSFRSIPAPFLDKNGRKFAWRSKHTFNNGDSGGPVTSRDGHLIGVIRGQSGAESAFLPILRFKAKLDEHGIVFDCGQNETSTSNGILAGAVEARQADLPTPTEASKRLLLTPQFNRLNVWRESDFVRDKDGNRIFLIKFLDGTERLHDKVVELAHDWTSVRHGEGVGARLVFKKTTGNTSHARIKFTNRLIHSYVGTKAKDAKEKPTAWFPRENKLFSSNRNERSLAQRWIVREFGHILGMSKPKVNGLSAFVKMETLNEVCALFENSLEQCGTLQSAASMIYGASTERSVMSYDVPANLAKDGKIKSLGAGTPRDADLSLAERMYP